MKKTTIEQEESGALTKNEGGQTARPEIEIVHLDLDRIKRSPTQPRKHFDDKTQEELEQSMKQHGFTISALLVRPAAESFYVEHDAALGLWHVMRKCADGSARSENSLPSSREAAAALAKLGGDYELVCGERRWRAAKAVGITTAPVIIRVLTDNEAFIIQLIENIQRDNLTPLEEADGYRRALEMKKEDGSFLYTVESLGKSVGKSKQTIWRMLRLCTLDEKTRDLVARGKLSIEIAVLVGRIGDEGLREQALQKILTPKTEAGPLSRTRARDLIHAEFTCDLTGAPFDQEDAGLVPVETNGLGERCAGGACTDCPMKSGNAKGRVDDLPSRATNVCLNPGCYARKKAAVWAQWQAKETDATRNRRALSQEECERLYGTNSELFFGSGLVDLAEHPDGNDLKPGEASPGTWKKILKGIDIEILVARDGNGKVHELVKRELAVESAAKIYKQFRSQEEAKAAREGGGPVDEEKAKADRLRERHEREVEAKVENAKVIAVREAVMGKGIPPKMSRDFWRLAAAGIIDAVGQWDDCNLPAYREGWDLSESEQPSAYFLRDRIKKMETPQLLALCVDLLATSGIPIDPVLPAWAKLYGVNLKSVERKAALAIAQEDAARRTVGEGMRWVSGPPLAEGDFEWNENGVCTNPDQLELEFPKSFKVAVVLHVASRGGKWYSGVELALKDAGGGGAPNVKSKPEKSWVLAALDEAYGARGWLTDKKVDQKVIDVLNGYIDALIEMDMAAKGGGRRSEGGGKKSAAKGAKKGGAK